MKKQIMKNSEKKKLNTTSYKCLHHVDPFRAHHLHSVINVDLTLLGGLLQQWVNGNKGASPTHASTGKIKQKIDELV